MRETPAMRALDALRTVLEHELPDMDLVREEVDRHLAAMREAVSADRDAILRAFLTGETEGRWQLQEVPAAGWYVVRTTTGEVIGPVKTEPLAQAIRNVLNLLAAHPDWLDGR